MKKVLIGLAGMVILALVVVLFVNAQSSSTVDKKAATEVASKCAGCKDAATCTEKKETTEAKAAPCCDEAKTETTVTAKAGCETTCPMKQALPVN